MPEVLHITTLKEWLAAKKFGSYVAGSLTSEGFIHCSTPDQVLRVADTYFVGQRGLVLLIIDTSHLKSEIRWEPGTNGHEEIFPHVYGPINLEAVVSVITFAPGMDGRFKLPPGYYHE